MKVLVCVTLASILASVPLASAQPTAVLEGRLVSSLNGALIAGATVVVDELKREVVSGADGSFRFDNIAPGTYHVWVRAQGYSSRRTEITVPAGGGAPVDVRVDFDLHFQEVASVSAEVRSQFDAFQPTSVLSGQELTKQLESSLGATLENQPGIASRSFGPSPSRPVIRGLDGDRVQILQDGQRTGDLSSQSGDHGVTVNPAAAERIEVVRGPATLLYGANAIGGLVNIITNEIPTQPFEGTSGEVTLDLGSAATEGGGAGHVRLGNGKFALNVGGGGRRSDDFDTPLGTVANSQSRSGFTTVGAGWTGEKVHVGASYGYDDTKYGIPVVEGGTLQLTPRRHALTFRTGAERLTGAFEGFRATLALRRYQHDELEGSEVGTNFRNDTTELQVMGSHRAIGRLRGSLGGWVLDRAFAATGAEALSPAVDQHGFAVFAYEEVTWPHVTLQFGGRVDRTNYTPLAEPKRNFTNGSVSAGLLLRPAAADDRLTIAASVARAARAPALEELFFFGLHHGNFALEVGNPTLESERALGVDLSLRWRAPRASGEVTYFRNDIGDYIFRRVMAEEEFDERLDAFVRRFGGREPAGHEHEDHDHENHDDEEEAEHETEEHDGHVDEDDDHAQNGHDGEEGLAFVEFVGADAMLQGLEAHADVHVTQNVVAELGLDLVRGSLKASDLPLPRIPPVKVRAGLRYQRNALQIGGQVVGAAKQDRLSTNETATEGYTLLKLYGSYSFDSGGAVHTITARVDNVTNELYRNHLSLIKDVVPEIGRNFKAVYSVSF